MNKTANQLDTETLLKYFNEAKTELERRKVLSSIPMTPDIQALREEFKKCGESYYYEYMTPVQIAMTTEWWLFQINSKLSSYTSTLIERIEKLESAGESSNVVWRHDVLSIIRDSTTL